MNFGLIVEGHGEVQALPILVRRIAAWAGVEGPVVFPEPLRVHRSSIVKAGELERAVELMARKTGPGAPILVLLDADEECAVELASALRSRAVEARSDRAIAVVIAVQEFEAWLLAGGSCLAGECTLPSDLALPDRPETLKSPKSWFDRNMARGYTETVDQAKLTARFDLAEARRDRSFRKFVKDACRLLGRDEPT